MSASRSHSAPDCMPVASESLTAAIAGSLTRAVTDDPAAAPARRCRRASAPACSPSAIIAGIPDALPFPRVLRVLDPVARFVDAGVEASVLRLSLNATESFAPSSLPKVVCSPPLLGRTSSREFPSILHPRPVGLTAYGRRGLHLHYARRSEDS